MDRSIPKYSSTKLKKMFFDIDNYEDEMEFSIKISHSIQEIEEKYFKNEIRVLGELEAKNSRDEVATTIIMESSFESNEIITEEELENDDYYHKPLFTEISLLLGSITGKAFNLPMLLPPFKTEDLENAKEDTE